MAAYEIPNLRFSGLAAAAVTRRRFVKPVSDTGYQMSGAGEIAVGVSMNDPKINEVLEMADGIVIVEAGEVITVGQEIEVGTNGVAMVLDTGIKVGTAITPAGAAEELLSVKTIV